MTPISKKYTLLIQGLIFLMVMLASCDGTTGINGTVIDKETQQAVEDAEVTFDSNYKDRVVYSNSGGYFEVFSRYSCGIKKCISAFSIHIKKEGYKDFTEVYEMEVYDQVIELEKE